MKVSHITFFLLLLRIHNLQKLLVLLSCSHFKSNTYSDTMLAFFILFAIHNSIYEKKLYKSHLPTYDINKLQICSNTIKMTFYRKKIFSEHFNKNQLIYPFKTKIVGQNKMIVKIWMYLILKLHQYETNGFYIKNSKNFFIQYWFRRETGWGIKSVRFSPKQFIIFNPWKVPWNWIAFYQNSFVMSPGSLYHLIRRDSGRLANEALTSNPIVFSKQ